MTIPKIEKAVGRAVISLSSIRPRWSTRSSVWFYERWGMNFQGRPNYISSQVWFDGADYGLITLCEGCTISSQVSFLTHDWSVYNVGRALGEKDLPAVPLLRRVHVGPFTFVGRGAIVMPGSTIGRGSVIAGGSVVRGEIPEYSLVLGNPGEVVGDSRDHYRKHKHRLRDNG